MKRYFLSKKGQLIIVSTLMLQASCEKSRETGKSETAGSSESRSTRAERSEREKAVGPVQKLRLSLAAVKKMESQKEKDVSLAEIARSAFELDSDIAKDAVRGLSHDCEERLALIHQLASVLIEKNPEDAIEWANSLGDPADVQLAREQVALVLVDSNPERAVQLLSKTGFPKMEPDGVAIQVLQAWTVKSPTEAASWILRFPPGDSRDSGMKAMVNQWVNSDAQSMFSWMSKIPNEAVRSEVDHAMAKSLANVPDPIRDSLLEPADPETRSNLEAQIAEINKAPEGEETPEKSDAPAEPETQYVPETQEPSENVEE